MRKALTIIIGFVSLFFLSAVKASAEEIKYKNLITDNTTIEDDFKILGMEISDYYIPTAYNYAKFYVVAMSEAYVENNNIQTYFYVYNPSRCQEIQIDNFEYTLNNFSSVFFCNINTETSKNGLYKVKGFAYQYEKDVEIKITKVNGRCITRDNPDIFSDPQEHIIELSSDSGFVAKNSHSLVDDEAFTCELNYNSTLILEDYEAVDVLVDDDYFEDFWKHFWQKGWGITNELHLVFYNFNFPKNIKPDTIEYAKFQYDYVEARETWQATSLTSTKYTKDVLSSEKRISEYLPGTREFSIDGQKNQLEFQTFVLGNRIDKGEFGKLKFTNQAKEKFKYDCSILLESNIFIKSNNLTATTLTSLTLQEIEFLELHYTKNGILYKCQIVSKPVNPTPIKPEKEKSWLQKLLLWLGENTVHFFSPKTVWPEWAYMVLGALELLVLILISIIVLLPKLIFLPFKIIGKILKL